MEVGRDRALATEQEHVVHLRRDGFGLEPGDVVVSVGGHRGEGVGVRVRLGRDAVRDRHVHGHVLVVDRPGRVHGDPRVERADDRHGADVEDARQDRDPDGGGWPSPAVARGGTPHRAPSPFRALPRWLGAARSD